MEAREYSILVINEDLLDYVRYENMQVRKLEMLDDLIGQWITCRSRWADHEDETDIQEIFNGS